jgi:predicted membrane-bound mannosyltransferase/DNA-binding beta-propeller fold protein YncE
MQSTIEERPSWLSRPLLSTITISLELVLFVVIIGVAVLSRFYNLGNRVMSHDEVSHVYFSWLLYTGQGYQHDPVTHGPLQFHLIALSYFLFNDTDFTARIPAALFSIAAIIFAWQYRRYLGKAGAIVAALLLTISPYLLYYGRYARNESYVEFYGLVTLWSILRYFESGKPRYLYYLTAATVFHFCSKETAYIYTAQALLFLFLYLVNQVSNRHWVIAERRGLFLRLFYAGVILILFTLIFFILSGRAVSQAASEVPAIPGQVLTSSADVFKFIAIGSAVLGALFLAGAVYTLVTGYTWEALSKERSFDMLILLGTLVLPLLSAFVIKALGLKIPVSAGEVRAMAANVWQIIAMATIVILAIILSAVIGISWNPRVWLGNAALFYSVFVVLYTTIFTNGAGLATGLVGSLGYWLEQQGVNRGSQPWYYYILVQVPIYEYLPALASILGVILLAFRKRLTRRELPETTESLDDNAQGKQTAPVMLLLGYWAISSITAYTIAGEKMPWLTVHIALPLILVAAWVIGYLIDTMDWKPFRTTRGYIILALLPVFLTSTAAFLGSLLSNNPPFQGKGLDQLQATSGFITALLAAFASGWGLWWLLKEWNYSQTWRIFTLAVFSLFALLTARTAYLASYVNYDNATEYLVYAHSGPGPKIALAQVEEISRRTTDGLALEVAYDDKTTYPYWWYLRDYPLYRFYGANPTRDLREVPAIIVGDTNYGKIEPIVGQAYYMFEYIRMWWPNQDYFNLTWKRIWDALSNPQMRTAIFNIWLNRDFKLYGTLTGKDMSLPNWDPAERMRLYLRKDIAAKLWNYGTSPAPEEIVADPYEGKELTLSADLVIGTAGSEPGQFLNPHNVAIAPDGTLYVLDSGNSRVQHLTPIGDILQVWGSFADAAQGEAPPGTFNDPWGIAVGPDGSVYVADTWNHRIQKFSATGEFIKMWGFGISQTEDPFGFYGPRGIAVDNDGRVYVTDTGNKRILIYDGDGNFITDFGEEGFGPGQFNEPVGISIGTDGKLFIADTWNQRIQVINPVNENTYLALIAWDIAGWYGQSLTNYPYLAASADGHLFATDPEGNRVLEFTTQGEFIRFWGDYGVTSDRFNLPQGIAIDPNGGIWVCDTGNGRLMHFKLPP